MMYTVCEYCGAHLDPGEPCECRKYTDLPGQCGNEEIKDPLQQAVTLDGNSRGQE